jgi:hypothetical protein
MIPISNKGSIGFYVYKTPFKLIIQWTLDLYMLYYRIHPFKIAFIVKVSLPVGLLWMTSPSSLRSRSAFLLMFLVPSINLQRNQDPNDHQDNFLPSHRRCIWELLSKAHLNVISKDRSLFISFHKC